MLKKKKAFDKDQKLIGTCKNNNTAKNTENVISFKIIRKLWKQND